MSDQENTDSLRVAIVGAGPAGFYTAQHLLKQDRPVEVDMFDRLPTPFGLVRVGVAPDHQKIKSVTRQFDKVAENPAFRFFGNVEIGKHITVAELENHYHQIVYATGAETDRRLDIPGEDLAGSYAATEFVAWYNGHPDYINHQFDLSQETAVVVGVGNVAIDVARILCRSFEELAQTDIADYALAALKKSKVRTVYVLGRRGPAQAAFTLAEIKEMGELEAATPVIPPDDLALDPLSQQEVADKKDRATNRKLAVMAEFAQAPDDSLPRNLIFRFLVSPVELLGDRDGHLCAVKLVHNELYRSESDRLRPRATDRVEVIPAGLLFRSIGYRGVPIPGVPFHERWGVIHNEYGRVRDSENGSFLVGHYAAGWIKRGPSGVIGTNKPDAVETVDKMMADVAEGLFLQPSAPDREAVSQLIADKQPDYFTYADWRKLDTLETEAGAEQGRPRVKFTSLEEMLKAIKG